MTTTKGVLDGLTVLELGDRVAAGAVGTLLAQLGAHVVLVEPPVPAKAHKWRNRPIASVGKQSIVVDRNSTAGRELLHRMAASADIVLTSSDVTPAEREFWKPEQTSGPIVCDITAFGHSGPMAGLPWPEHLIAAVAGTADTTGPADAPPTLTGSNVMEMHAAVLATSAVLAAQRVRRRSGLAQTIDVAVFDVAVTGLINFFTIYLSGRPASRSGNRHPLYCPWGTFHAADGWLLICATTDEQWARIADAMGQPELARDPRFAKPANRVENFRLVDELVTGWAKTRSVAECEEILVGRAVACGQIVTLDTLASQKNIEHRQTVGTAEDPIAGRTVNIPRSAIRVAGSGPAGGSRVPRPDEDRTGVLAWLETAEKAGPRRAAPGEAPKAAFDGVRLVEIGHYTVAPMASRILGSLGAEVVKVESPAGDAIRTSPPFREDGGGSYIFALSNTDKDGIVLDLRLEEDRETLHALLAQADAMLENLKPGSLAKLGFGGKELRKRHPHLITCSINGFGNDSVYPGRAALDTIIQAMSGLMSLTLARGVPHKTGISTSDMLGGEFALIALMLGIEARETTGEVLHFDLSMQDASLWTTQYEWNGDRTMGKAEMVKAKDGWVVVETPADEARARQLRERIAAAEASPLSRDALVVELSEFGPAAPVHTVPEAIEHPQTVSRELLVKRPTMFGDLWTVFATPYRLSRTPAEVKLVMSKLGASDERVRQRFGLGQRQA